MKIHTIETQIEKLSTNQKKDLIEYIKNSYSIFDEYTNLTHCPYCESKHFIKHDNKNNVQRYLSKDCGKTFTYKTNTVLKGIQSQNLIKWNLFVEDFLSLNITPLNEISKKLEISKQTAFNWRHKLIASLETKGNVKFSNECVEFDETYFLISRKGRQNMNFKNRYWRKSQVGDSNYNVKLFFAYGRDSKQLELTQSHMGRTSVSDLENYFIGNKFKNITALTDRHGSYKAFFKEFGIEQKTFLSKDHVNPENKEIHNQTVNAYIRNFKDFTNKHLRGVSTKYLISYAKWFEFVNLAKSIIKKQLKTDVKVKFNIADNICKNIVTDHIGLELYRQSEYRFEQFLRINGRSNFGDCKNHYYACA